MTTRPAFRMLRLAGLFVCFHGWLLPVGSLADAQVIPVFDPDRYQALWSRSPFGIDTAPVAVAAEGPSFAEDLVISGIMSIDGNESVVLLNTRNREFTRAVAGTGGKYELVSLHVDRDRRKSWAMIRHGEETAEVRFPEQKTNPVSKLGVGPGGAVARDGSRDAASTRQGIVASGAVGGQAAAGDGRDRRMARSGPGAAGAAAATPSQPPPRRRVILPRKR